MAMKITTRDVQESDAEEIARLSAELGYPSPVSEIADRLRLLAASSNHWVQVAESKGRMLGWIAAERRIMLESGIKYEIAGLVVDAKARRLGVGSLLVQAIQKLVAHQGACSLYVRSNIARQESHPFYESLGFKRAKTQHVYRIHIQA